MNAKKVVLVLLVVFLGFWMFTDPSGLARSAGNLLSWVWQTLQTLFSGMIRFVNELS